MKLESPGNSDQIDARAIKAARYCGEGIERFPVAFLDEDAMEIRLLCDHREALVNERKRLVSSGRHDRHRLDRGGNRQLQPSASRHCDHPRGGSTQTTRLSGT